MPIADALSELGQLEASMHRMRCIVSVALLLVGIMPGVCIGQSFFDSMVESTVDQVNKHVIQEDVDQQTRALQISALKTALRGSDSDWEELMATATEAFSGDSPSAESNKSYQRFTKGIKSMRETVGPVTYFNGTVEGLTVSVEIPAVPIEGKPSTFAYRKAKIHSIHPIQVANSKSGNTYFLILSVEEDKSKSNRIDWLCNADRTRYFGLHGMIVDEERSVNSVSDFESATVRVPGLGWDDEMTILERDYGVITNLPDVLAFDVTGDGSDEIILKGYVRGGFLLYVYGVNTKASELNELETVLVCSEGRPGEANYKRIWLEGDQILLDGRPLKDL